MIENSQAASGMASKTQRDSADIPAMRARITESLRAVYDPELGVNIIDLGLVYGIEVDDKGQVLLTMTLTTPGCPMHESLASGVVAALETIPDLTGGEVRLVWEPPWEPSRMTEAGRLALAGW